MTESDWLTGDDPRPMLAHLLGGWQTTLRPGAVREPVDFNRRPGVTDRKLRLFAAAAWRLRAARRGGEDWAAREAVACRAEAIADGLAEAGDWAYSWTGYGPVQANAAFAALGLLGSPGVPCLGLPGEADLLRDVFGNVFRPVMLDRSWLTPTVVAIARRIYDDRAFADMPVLHDALVEAGCTDEAILAHCRGQERCPECFDGPEGARVYCEACDGSGRKGWVPLRGPHVRGCWVIDLLLGKE